MQRNYNAPVIKLYIPEFDRLLTFLVDTGAAVNLIRQSEISPTMFIEEDNVVELKGITPHSLPTLGKVKIFINGVATEFYLVAGTFPIKESGILGTEFLKMSQAKINYPEYNIEIAGEKFPFENMTKRARKMLVTDDDLIFQPYNQIEL